MRSVKHLIGCVGVAIVVDYYLFNGYFHPGLQPSAVASLKPNALERRAIPKYFFEPIYSQDFINERIHRTGEQAENIDAIFLFCGYFWSEAC